MLSATLNRTLKRHPGRKRILSNGTDRDGAAAVEAAFCIPLVVVLMLGTLEVCSGLFLAETLTVSAFEACRAGVRRRRDAQDVYDRAVEVLEARNITLPTDANGQPVGITIEPSDFSELRALDPITVTITAPTAGNSTFIFEHFVNRNVSASVTMVREFDD